MICVFEGIVVNGPAANLIGFHIIMGDAADFQIFAVVVRGREDETFHANLAFKVMP